MLKLYEKMDDKGSKRVEIVIDIEDIKNNNEKVLREIYTKYYYYSEQFILTNSGTSEDAKDIYQEAFIVFWRNVQLGNFQQQHAKSIGAYLLQVVKNKWIDILRKNKNHPMTTLVYDLPDISGTYMDTEEEKYMELVKKHYMELGEPCKTLLEKFYFKKESMQKIAQHFSWTVGSAKNNKYRCLQKLREKIKQNMR
ncbi:MAG: sigma-70 family RNA polymerase sigma factor [Chitinophagales bacterium]|nr:sigma-70 family RNA polymerase sigma factor [Chitinophagales bacterium]